MWHLISSASSEAMSCRRKYRATISLGLSAPAASQSRLYCVEIDDNSLLHLSVSRRNIASSEKKIISIHSFHINVKNNGNPSIDIRQSRSYFSWCFRPGTVEFPNVLVPLARFASFYVGTPADIDAVKIVAEFFFKSLVPFL